MEIVCLAAEIGFASLRTPYSTTMHCFCGALRCVALRLDRQTPIGSNALTIQTCMWRRLDSLSVSDNSNVTFYKGAILSSVLRLKEQP
jgi:hypothetical protein